MNAIHEPADQLQPRERPATRAATASTARGTVAPRAGDCGSYGRGSYAGHSTYGLDFSSQGSYGRGSYAGHSTYGLDFSSQGSYGRGIYTGHSTYDLDFRPQDSYARGTQQGRLPVDAQRAPRMLGAVARTHTKPRSCI
jgi:hypothetical protein